MPTGEPPTTVADAADLVVAQLGDVAVDGDRALPRAELHEAVHVDDHRAAVVEHGVVLEEGAHRDRQRRSQEMPVSLGSTT